MKNEARKKRHIIAADGSVMTFMTAEFMLDEREVKQLEELLGKWRAYKAKDGTQPFKDWEIEDVFQAIMETGGKHTINHHMKNCQFSFGMINANQLCNSNFIREPCTTYTQEEGKE